MNVQDIFNLSTETISKILQRNIRRKVLHFHNFCFLYIAYSITRSYLCSSFSISSKQEVHYKSCNPFRQLMILSPCFFLSQVVCIYYPCLQFWTESCTFILYLVPWTYILWIVVMVTAFLSSRTSWFLQFIDWKSSAKSSHLSSLCWSFILLSFLYCRAKTS